MSEEHDETDRNSTSGAHDDLDLDLDELRHRVEELAAATEAVRAYGEANDLPVFERTATRIEGSVATLKQNVPGMLTDAEE